MNRRERFEDSGNLVANHADRPGVVVATSREPMVVTYARPLFVARVVHGRTIGGGVSKEALQRAKRRARGVHHQPLVGAWMENVSLETWLSRNQQD